MEQERTTDRGATVPSNERRAPDAMHAGSGDSELTSRERVVLSHIAAGRSDQAIADLLGISITTVKKHTAKIVSKLNAASRTEAAIRGVKDGIIN